MASPFTGLAEANDSKEDMKVAGPPSEEKYRVRDYSLTSGGSIYVRWGRSTCPEVDGTYRIYDGLAGKTYFTYRGGGGNYLCMPKDPDYAGAFAPGVNNVAVFGVEYETYAGSPLRPLQDQNVPCAVCQVNARSSVLMIPGKLTCPTGWTKEYNGYLMTSHYSHFIATYECVDRNPKPAPGGAGNQNGGLFYQVEASCTGLKCPPYHPQKELSCVVCSI